MKSLERQVRPWTFRAVSAGDKDLLGLPTLQEIVDVLNGDKDPDTTELLQTLVRRWKGVDWDVDKLCKADPLLAAVLPKLWMPPMYLTSRNGGATIMPMFFGPTSTRVFFEHFVKDGPLKKPLKGIIRDAGLKGVKDKAAAGDAFRGGGGPLQPGVEDALLDGLLLDHFQHFLPAIQYFGALTVLEWEKLGGPCARCKRYYIKRRASQKTYCSRRCGNAATATARTAKQREYERQDNLQRADKAIQQWKGTGKKTDWKEFVTKKTGLTAKFLTRAVGRNDLKAPKEKEETQNASRQ
jgi:hypothetical protein